MKKYLLGICTILCAIAFSAFYQLDNKDLSHSNNGTAEMQNSKDDLYWFEVEVGHGDQITFSNGEVSFLDGPLPKSAAPDQGCPTTADNACVVGFSIDQINLDMTLKLPQTQPEDIKSKRNTP